MGDLTTLRSSSKPAADEGLGAGVTDAVEEREQVEETADASEGVGMGRSPVRLGLIGVGVSGKRRLVTSPSGAAAFRCRLTASELGVGEPGGPGVLVWGLIGIAAGGEREEEQRRRGEAPRRF